ncbi:hypothetical protein DNTS_013469 [Danionella cerebrum]|uniref:FHA domain-containing protein n=1 Tax=Danionella cerebrum TaxID=2873325 RepID=A0A553MQ66_9TELE|nr:hypothetical protein DNTS_013469 [Danionella translucida]
MMESTEEVENSSTEVEKEKSLDSDHGIKDTAGEACTNINTDNTFKKPDIFVATLKKTLGPGSNKKSSEELNSITQENKDIGPDPKLHQPDQLPQQNVHSKPKDTRPKIPAKPPTTVKCPPLPYTEPLWGSVPEVNYSFELLKNGAILDTVPLTQRGYFVVGRLPVCDVSLEHPSISRYHAVVQYRGRAGEDGVVGEERGFYAYDLGSTHGTFVNKNKIPPKTYIRLHVGHVLKFGGSTRLFILQGPECDEEAESDLTVTELRALARKQKEELEKRMMGDGSDEEAEKEEREENVSMNNSSEDTGCSWGMAEEAAPEEDENEDNPFATEFQEDQEAALPVDDAVGRQLVAEATHTGKKKEAAVQCCLEACRILEARGLLRQEAVSRKRKKKNWEDDDFYDSDDDTFLDRTGMVEKKRTERMKRAGKIHQRPDTYGSLLNKLAEVEKELSEANKKLCSSGKGGSSSSTEDPLDAFMSVVRSDVAMDGVERKKLHLHVAGLRKEAQRLRKLAELAKPTELPSLQDHDPKDPEKPKKLSLPLFGAMKGGSKFKLKTGTIGSLPPKRANLPPELFNLKEIPPGGEEEEEEEEEKQQEVESKAEDNITDGDIEVTSEKDASKHLEVSSETPKLQISEKNQEGDRTCKVPSREQETSLPKVRGSSSVSNVQSAKTKKKLVGPSRPPATMSRQYPEDDPDYCVWVPPQGQTGDGRTHLNDKYGY